MEQPPPDNYAPPKYPCGLQGPPSMTQTSIKHALYISRLNHRSQEPNANQITRWGEATNGQRVLSFSYGGDDLGSSPLPAASTNPLLCCSLGALLGLWDKTADHLASSTKTSHPSCEPSDVIVQLPRVTVGEGSGSTHCQPKVLEGTSIVLIPHVLRQRHARPPEEDHLRRCTCCWAPRVWCAPGSPGALCREGWMGRRGPRMAEQGREDRSPAPWP